MEPTTRLGERNAFASKEGAAIADMAQTLARLAADHELREETWDDPTFWNVEASRSERCQFLAVGNAINFRFWDLLDGEVVAQSGFVEGEWLRGALYMWRRLRVATQRGELDLRSAVLSALDETTFRNAFRDDDGNEPLLVGLTDRVTNLRDLGEGLGRNWSGEFVNVIDAAAGSLDLFATLSKGFRAFDDPVEKLTMLNAIMLQGSGLVSFDHDPLPAVDYHLVKQALRQGLVRPAPALAHKLRAGHLLEQEESTELRLRVLEALTIVADQGHISTAVLDNLYWLNRRICADRKPDCEACPFRAGCAKHLEFGLPLELTRYY
jgi:hypothetical protein